MNTISQGAQYKVIDTHDGRVRKLPLRYDESLAVLQRWYAPGEVPVEDLAADYCRLALDSCAVVQDLLDRYSELSASFGNPHFEGEGAYSQDKVQLFGEALSRRSMAEGKKLIDSFINLVLYHWQYGLSEEVFNCTFNNGLASDNRVTLLDFGEITTDKARVEEAINSQKWLRSISYIRDIPERLKSYYRYSLAERLTVKTLETYWGSRL